MLTVVLQEYGSVFQLQMGSMKALVISEEQDKKEVLHVKVGKDKEDVLLVKVTTAQHSTVT